MFKEIWKQWWFNSRMVKVMEMWQIAG